MYERFNIALLGLDGHWACSRERKTHICLLPPLLFNIICFRFFELCYHNCWVLYQCIDSLVIFLSFFLRDDKCSHVYLIIFVGLFRVTLIEMSYFTPRSKRKIFCIKRKPFTFFISNNNQQSFEFL